MPTHLTFFLKPLTNSSQTQLKLISNSTQTHLKLVSEMVNGFRKNVIRNLARRSTTDCDLWCNVLSGGLETRPEPDGTRRRSTADRESRMKSRASRSSCGELPFSENTATEHTAAVEPRRHCLLSCVQNRAPGLVSRAVMLFSVNTRGWPHRRMRSWNHIHAACGEVFLRSRCTRGTMSRPPAAIGAVRRPFGDMARLPVRGWAARDGVRFRELVPTRRMRFSLRAKTYAVSPFPRAPRCRPRRRQRMTRSVPWVFRARCLGGSRSGS